MSSETALIDKLDELRTDIIDMRFQEMTEARLLGLIDSAESLSRQARAAAATEHAAARARIAQLEVQFETARAGQRHGQARIAELEAQLATEQEDNDASEEHSHTRLVLYRAAVEAADAEVKELRTQLAERSEWEPVEDGEYQYVDVDANGSELITVTKDVHGIEWDAMIMLPDNIRLCRWQEGDTPQPLPDWTQAPEWANWWAIEPNGQSIWYAVEPYCDADEGGCWCGQFDDSGNYDAGELGKKHRIPLGIDWRLLKQQRPQPTDDDSA